MTDSDAVIQCSYFQKHKCIQRDVFYNYQLLSLWTETPYPLLCFLNRPTYLRAATKMWHLCEKLFLSQSHHRSSRSYFIFGFCKWQLENDKQSLLTSLYVRWKSIPSGVRYLFIFLSRAYLYFCMVHTVALLFCPLWKHVLVGIWSIQSECKW